MAQPNDLLQIAQQLQAYVKAQGAIAPNLPFQVQCALKNGTLMVLGQHLSDRALNPQEIFTTLKAGLRMLGAELASLVASANSPEPTHLPIKLYLRQLGDQHPYQTDKFLYELPPPSQWAASSLELSEEHDPELLTSASDRLALLEQAHDPMDQVATPAHHRVTVRQLPYVIGAILGVVVCAIAGYGLSRPCVLGGCQPLEQAETLGQQLASAQTEADIQTLTAQLPEMQTQLEQVPPWSGQYAAAQASQAVMDQVQQAEQQAATAYQVMQSLPQPVTALQTAQTQWQGAIAQLQSVPADSPFATYGHRRIGQYQAQLTAIAALINREQQAQQQLQTAKKTIELATAREKLAEQPAQWQEAQVTWQMAVTGLQTIAPMTTSHAEAQTLLQTCQGRAKAIRDRAWQEKTGNDALRQAQSLSQQATAAEQQNQWSQAMSYWRQAVTAAQQVPSHASQYEQSQALVTTYTASLKQAERFLQIRTDLEKVCAGTMRICDYTIASDLIKVRLTPAYEKKLTTEAILSRSAGDIKTLQGIRRHLGSLETAFQAVSNNAGIGVDVYLTSSEALIGSFTPQ